MAIKNLIENLELEKSNFLNETYLKIKNLFESALELEAEKKLSEPEKLERANAYKGRGNEMFKARKYAEAVELYSAAIFLVADSEIFYTNRAAAHSMLGNRGQVVADCEKAIELNEFYIKPYIRLGDLYFNEDKVRARKYYDTALELDPENESIPEKIKMLEKSPDNIPNQEMENKNGTESQYGDLINKLNLDPAMVEKAKEMMGNMSPEEIQKYMKMFSGNGQNFK